MLFGETGTGKELQRMSFTTPNRGWMDRLSVSTALRFPKSGTLFLDEIGDLDQSM
jgi:transcriptional regulator with PAS, ATPase and Fis domain